MALLRTFVSAVVVVSLVLAGCGDYSTPPLGSMATKLLVSPLEGKLSSSPDLAAILVADPYAYFRFVNRRWEQVVCETFGEEIRNMPLANLQGDAHLAQYAVSATAHGLDDFDDAASGPAVLDLVRFVASIDLACRCHGWEAERRSMVDQFLKGYGDGLKDPNLVSPVPDYVGRIRKSINWDRSTFLAWAESLMRPIEPDEMQRLEARVDLFTEMMHQIRPELPRGFFRLKRAGYLRMGVGSRLDVKGLMRVEGPSSDPDDDIILEAKTLGRARAVECVHVPPVGEVQRVLVGSARLGRIPHEILGYVPRDEELGSEQRIYWVKSWEPSYHELTIDELKSPDDIRQISYDVGVQLGHGHVSELESLLADQFRYAQYKKLERFGGRVSEVATLMVEAMLEAWKVFREEAARQGLVEPQTPPTTRGELGQASYEGAFRYRAPF